MFDLRYHVTSLAAVFIALLIGILVGVALASHGLGNSERKSLEDDVRRAQNRSGALQSRVDALQQQDKADSSFVEDTYNALMTDRLKDKRVAVLFVGSVDHAIQSDIAAAIKDAGGGTPSRLYAVQVPIDAAAIDKRLGNNPALAKYAGPDHLRQLGQQLGRAFVTGGNMPIWSALHKMIVQEATPRFGASRRPADAVIVVRTADPQTGNSAPFVKGLYEGIGKAGVPAVGVAKSNDDFNAKPVFQQSQLSTVDDVDLDAGKLALAIVLSTPASRADYGVNANDLLPPVTPVLTPSG
ncbi:MAG TPA: copper transporter [Gaiellaceae bacterium]|nr:copper transporter [Gaiellaceae bacterium]